MIDFPSLAGPPTPVVTDCDRRESAALAAVMLGGLRWAWRVYALPFMAALVLSERACREWSRRHKSLLDVGRQLAPNVSDCLLTRFGSGRFDPASAVTRSDRPEADALKV